MKYWLTFVGEGRSGHTIVSAILGSHPHIRLGEEQKYISKWCRSDMSKKDILTHLFQSGKGKYRASMGLRGLTEYEEPLLVIGDKCGWDAVNEVKKRGQAPDILNRFSTFMDMPVKVIHTSRHPLDNITAWLDSPKYQRMYTDNELLHKRMIRRYCRFYETAEEVMGGQDVFHLRNEELIANPSTVIQQLSDWLELPSNREWRRHSAARVSKSPNKRSNAYPWIEKYKEQVLTWRVIDRFPSLGVYYGKED